MRESPYNVERDMDDIDQQRQQADANKLTMKAKSVNSSTRFMWHSLPSPKASGVNFKKRPPDACFVPEN